jgi:hypothetical protein
MAPSCATEQYNVVLQPLASLIIPVSGFSNDNSLKDSAAWSKDGAQETAPLERIMDQHALIITVHDVAHAAWKLESVRKWLKTLQKEHGEKSVGQDVMIKQEPGVPAVQPRPQSASSATSQPLPMQTLIRRLPTLLQSLNDLAAIRKLVAEIELPGDDDNSRADGGRARKQQQQELTDELPSLIQFATKSTDASLKMVTATSAPTIIKSEPGLHQAKTGPTDKTPLLTTGITTARRNDDKQLSPPTNTLAAAVIKQEPCDNSHCKGPTATAATSKSPTDKINNKSKKPVLSPPQKSTLPSTKGAGSVPEKISAVEKKRKQQEMDFAEKKRRDGIAWQAQPSHPEDQPLLVNKNKKQKKKATPPLVVETLTKGVLDKERKNKLEIVPPMSAGTTRSRYTDLFNNVPNTTTATTAPYTYHSMGAGNTVPLVRNITRLVPRIRPPLERPRYIINTLLDNGNPVPAPIPRRWKRILIRWHGVDLTTFSGEFLVRPIKEAPQAPPPNTGFSSWFDSMHDVDQVGVPPLDEDIDCNARVTSTYFDELNPTIEPYGVLPEYTMRIPAMLLSTGEVDVGGNPSISTWVPSGNGHTGVVNNGLTAHHPTHQTQQKQKPLPSKNAHDDEKSRRHSVSADYYSKSNDNYYEDYSDEYEDDSRGRSTYSRSRSRSYTRFHSRSLSPERNFQQGSELLPPKVWNDFFKNEPNRPRASHCQLERPSECIWQLTSSSRVVRSSVKWQEKSFDPVWRYEMRLQAILARMKNRTATMECIFDEYPLPSFYNQDFNTFFNFMSSRSHLFESTTVPRGHDTRNALITLREGASCLLEWKRRMLDYIKVEGRTAGFRVPLAEALLACPFPRDAHGDEIKDAQSNTHNYIVSKLGDAFYVILPKMWTNASVSYPYVSISPSLLNA